MIKYPTKEITKVVRDAGLPVGKAYKQKSDGGRLKLYAQPEYKKAIAALARAFPDVCITRNNYRSGFRKTIVAETRQCATCGHRMVGGRTYWQPAEVADLYIWW